MSTLNAAGTTAQRGASAQYGVSGQSGKAAYDSTKIIPRDTGTILGTVPPGKAGIKLVSGVIQNATDPLVVGQLSNNVADNFLGSTAASQGSGNAPAVNAAQAASAGKSMSPEHN